MLSNSLRGYIRHAWHVVEPSTVYLENWHIDLIAEYLEAVTSRRDRAATHQHAAKLAHRYRRRLVQPRLRHVSLSAIERAVGEFKRLHCAYSDSFALTIDANKPFDFIGAP